MSFSSQRFVYGFFFLFWMGMGCGITQAQKSGIKGKVLDQEGKPVPFATIGVAKTSLGTMANEEGAYKQDLPEGLYSVYFQCLGFQTVRKDIEISSTFQSMDVVLQEQVIQTREVTIGTRDEDPAYAIMRKTIARAKINKLMVDAYTAEVYVRGSGRILDLPMLMKPLAKKSGLDENTMLFKETLETIEFKQPKQYKEHVIASRSTFGMVSINQNYLKQDLYDPGFGSSVSPLSPSSFRYYRFQYLGAFSDRGHEVFKIKVIPKTTGQEFWAGELYIIDKLFCIHSAHLSNNYDGMNVTLTHTYGPIEEIWMPVQMRQEYKGRVIGIEVEGFYTASIRKYKLTKNIKLYAEYQKIEEDLDQKTNEAIKKNPQSVNFNPIEKLDKKTLRKLARAYVKEKYLTRKKDKKNTTPAAVSSSLLYTVDSTATKKDSLFWAENRAVPLTDMETRSYIKMDSIRVVDEKEDSLKSLKKKRLKGLSLIQYLAGENMFFGRKDSLGRKPMVLKIYSPLMNLSYNGVEGFSIQQDVFFKRFLRQSCSRFRDDRPFIQIGTGWRYSKGREKLLGIGTIQYGNPNFVVQVTGGTNTRQLNDENPILPIVNSTYARFFEQNFLKKYEADFVKIQFLQKLRNRFELEATLGWENRIPLRNPSLNNIFGGKQHFSPNEVTMPYIKTAVLNRSVLAFAAVSLDWYPFLQSSLYNEYQSFKSTSSPRFRFEVNQAIPGILNSTMDFLKAGLSYRHSIALSPRSQLELFSKAATMINNRKFGQMDALHVLGNQTVVLDERKTESFRNLSYYDYTSQKTTLEFHAHFYRSELISGWFFPKRKKWREMILVNGLANPDQPGFYEIGYGVDRIFQFFHVEVVRSQFQNATAQWSFLIGGRFDFNIAPKKYEKSMSPSSGF